MLLHGVFFIFILQIIVSIAYYFAFTLPFLSIIFSIGS